MLSIRRSTLVRSLFAAVIVAALAFAAVALAPAPTEAIQLAGPYICTYTDGSGTIVGQRGVGCCGENLNWGSTSSNVQCERLYCLDVICPW